MITIVCFLDKNINYDLCQRCAVMCDDDVLYREVNQSQVTFHFIEFQGNSAFKETIFLSIITATILLQPKITQNEWLLLLYSNLILDVEKKVSFIIET